MVENANLIEDPNALDTAQAKNSGEFIAGNEGRFFFFFVFQAGAAFLAICCILELKSVFCMHFGARISHLRAHLAFGFWLLALGFGFWFHLALVLAVHFTWLLAFVGF